MSRKKTKKGFTIIEVVLILAIAGLIFAAVFIAYPSMVRSQRDLQRRSNLALIVTAMNEWNRDHHYTVNDAWSERKNRTRGFCKFFNDYVAREKIVDPVTGEQYKAALWGSTRVIDCTTGLEYDRAELDPYATGTKVGTGWPLMEIGDIQYDDVAICSGESFDDHLGKSSGLKYFAFRMRLENGGYICLDSATTHTIKDISR